MSENLYSEPDFSFLFDTLPNVSELKLYQPPDAIDRSNFVPMLVESFRYSLGNMYRQIIYMEWMQAHSGCSWTGAIQTFQDRGGWQILTNEEQSYFSNNYKKVSQHRNSGRSVGQLDTKDYFAESLRVQLQYMMELNERNPNASEHFQEVGCPYEDIADGRALFVELNRQFPIDKSTT